MSNSVLNQLEQDLVTARGRVTKLETAIDALRALDGNAPAAKPRARKSASPAGARKSIFHPNATDVSVLDTMLTFTESEETPKLQMDWISKQSGIEKSEVQKAIKWLNSANKIETVGRGRGTNYKVLVTSNDLQVVDPATVGGSYRRSGGPTVKQIVRAVFNGLEPGQRVAPAKVHEIVLKLFPECGLTRQSYGQVFTKMALEGELQIEGDGRSRRYSRGFDKLDDAADVPTGFDFDQFFDEEVTTDDTTSTDDNTDNSNTDVAQAS